VTLFVTDTVGSVLRVNGVSMRPTFNPEQPGACDWVLVEKLSIKLLHQYHRGDVVVFW
jgi:signal peptidase I